MTNFHRLEQTKDKSTPEPAKTESKDWLCRVCDQQFENIDILKWHQYSVHNVEGKAIKIILRLFLFQAK